MYGVPSGGRYRRCRAGPQWDVHQTTDCSVNDRHLRLLARRSATDSHLRRVIIRVMLLAYVAVVWIIISTISQNNMLFPSQTRYVCMN